jgi:malate synthase
VHNEVRLDTGDLVTAELVRRILAEVAEVAAKDGAEESGQSRFGEARELFEQVALADDFADFLTIPAYEAVLAAETALT